MKIYRCDKCKKEFKSFKDNLVLIRAYRKSQSKGGGSESYHLCINCMKKIFRK